ncbi:TetR/AcrR family transcriptional regulator [Frigidibacter sp. MR17.14]|uniref:TetR/AcrR family transcriptional regulator n=1 Tax=Frigidibacter sp. MR17.14 TaxID=3126509 RepID=UPI003012CA78
MAQHTSHDEIRVSERSRGSAARQRDRADQIVDAAMKLFSEQGYGAVSLREIARESGVAVSTVAYHHVDKLSLLGEIYERYTRPMNARRLELLGEAQRIDEAPARLTAILRAYLLPAFTSSDDTIHGGARFTRMRAVLSAEGDPEARRIIAEAFDATTRQFIDAICACLPGAPREAVVWQCQFLLGALYYTLINPDRIDRLSDGRASGADHETAIGMIVRSTHASLMALPPPTEETAQQG